jgi:hypothetical protein
MRGGVDLYVQGLPAVVRVCALCSDDAVGCGSKQAKETALRAVRAMKQSGGGV